MCFTCKNANNVFPTDYVANIIMIVAGVHYYSNGLVIRFHLILIADSMYILVGTPSAWKLVSSMVVFCVIIFCVYFEELL